MTVEQNLEQNMLQGETLAAIIASNQVDTIGKQLLEEEEYFFV